MAVEPDRAGVDCRAGRKDAEDGANDGRLAASRLANNSENGAALQREIDMIEDAGRPLVGPDGQTQVADFEDRVGRRRAWGHRDRRRRGSTRSRRPSPSRLKPSTVRKIA